MTLPAPGSREEHEYLNRYAPTNTFSTSRTKRCACEVCWCKAPVGDGELIIKDLQGQRPDYYSAMCTGCNEGRHTTRKRL